MNDLNLEKLKDLNSDQNLWPAEFDPYPLEFSLVLHHRAAPRVAHFPVLSWVRTYTQLKVSNHRAKLHTCVPPISLITSLRSCFDQVKKHLHVSSNTLEIWGVPKIGVPPKSSKSLDHFSTETHGFGVPPF